MSDNGWIAAAPRLVDMGVDHYLLASTLRLVIAQRLVRTICRDCDGCGCKICNLSGYNGRSVIAEVLSIDSGFAGLIEKKETSLIYEQYARSKGFRPISEDGIEKVQWGVTTREEVMNILNN
jgi:type II secretory ATPase GspE/PulE/Tfp pilus assembly ATPase PilB-like protein